MGEGRGKEGMTYDEILEQGIAAFEVYVRATGEVRGLLEKDGVGSEDLADIDGDLLGGG
jgi:hypothetical protein